MKLNALAATEVILWLWNRDTHVDPVLVRERRHRDRRPTRRR
jgi:hypothetical protein